jgi:hypothetical protein
VIVLNLTVSHTQAIDSKQDHKFFIVILGWFLKEKMKTQIHKPLQHESRISKPLNNCSVKATTHRHSEKHTTAKPRIFSKIQVKATSVHVP